jgi:hypothetical protein
MTTDQAFPSLETFLTAPLDEIRALAPETMIFAAGGTRRSAALAGISTASDEFPRWSRLRMMACFDLLFQHGIRHLISHAIIPDQWHEVTAGYRQSLVRWIDWGLSGAEALADYARLGWRVRLLGTEDLSELADTAGRLEAHTTPDRAAPTLWFTVTPTDTCSWDHLLATVRRSGATTQREAICSLYGEDIPPATLLLGYGKPMLFPATLPPLLLGRLQCYWKQQPGYDLDQATLRTILYDFAHVRKTWRQDKSGRAEQAQAYRAIWEQAPILGLGMRLGPFWYPAPISPLPDDLEVSPEDS